MNVSTHTGIFGKWNKTSYPDGSINLFDPETQQHIDIKPDDLPLSPSTIEALFAQKYGNGQEKTA